MKVIVAGFPKTGTKSMNWALTTLGYKVYDFPENVYLLQNEYKKLFHDGWCAEDFQKMYQGVDAVVDTPACFFWEELAKAFPDAKIVLTIRDSEEEWLQSMKNLAAAAEGNIAMRLVDMLSYTQWRTRRNLMNTMGMVTMGWQPQSLFAKKYHLNDQMLKMKYRAHNAYVMHAAPKDRFLVYRCSDGWGPLCEFLGVPVPDMPFPHKNKAGSLVAEALANFPVFIRMQREVMASTALLLAGSSVVLFYTVKLGPTELCRCVGNGIVNGFDSVATFFKLK